MTLLVVGAVESHDCVPSIGDQVGTVRLVSLDTLAEEFEILFPLAVVFEHVVVSIKENSIKGLAITESLTENLGM